MSEAAVVGEGTEVNKGENARMASFVGALAIGTFSYDTVREKKGSSFCKRSQIYKNCFKTAPFFLHPRSPSHPPRGPL